jgi:endonuclease/exonuclease/phosphatase (EEP) superfamily protein YafD
MVFLRVMSFNVLAAAWLDSSITQNTSLSADERADRALRVILKKKPHVVLVQEMTTTLERKFKGTPYRVVCKKKTERENHPVSAVLLRDDAPLLVNKCQWGRLYCTLEGGKKLVIASLHFAYDNIPRMRRQLQDFLDARPTPTSNNTAYLYGGDFNAESRHFHADISKPRGFRDVMQRRVTHPNYEEDEMSISKFLVKGSIRAGRRQVLRAKTLRGTLSKFGSDHWPIMCTFNL